MSNILFYKVCCKKNLKIAVIAEQIKSVVVFIVLDEPIKLKSA